MAGLKTDARGNRLVTFRFGGRQFTRSAGTREPKAAEAVKARVEDMIFRLANGYASLPAGADPGEFIVSGGQRTGKAIATVPVAPPRALSLGDLFRMYEGQYPAGAKAETTLQTEGHHRAHLLRLLSPALEVEAMTLAQVQDYANRRSRETWRGRPISPPTVRKELATLRVIWNWARKQGHLAIGVPFLERDLDFARTEQRSPFQTYEAIAKTIRRGNLRPEEESGLWEALYLTAEEVGEVLEQVRRQARHPFIYPMLAFAALTGARRSEIYRSRVQDWDLETGTVTIRERKRKRGRTTFRTVDVHSLLRDVMAPWLADHPGGQFAICNDAERLTVKMATDHFQRTLARSKWAVIPGFHTFRHSFASILASRGVDETTNDRWMVHQTQEQRERYRHLFPKHRKVAIELLTGAAGA